MLAIRRVAVATHRCAARHPYEATALFSTDVWRKKERATECVFFNAESRKLLRKLVKQMKVQDDTARKQKTQDVEGLERLKGLDLTKEQVDALFHTTRP